MRRAWKQFFAGALERVCLPFDMRGCSSTRVRVRLSGCAYLLARVVKFSEGALERVCLAFGMCGYSSKRVRLSGCMRGYSSKQAHLRGCAYHLACVGMRGHSCALERCIPFGMRGYSSNGCT